jgi:C-terminal processing protease CtpA/Prc
LKRYVAVFDFPGQHLYLRPSPAFNAPETPHDKSGLQIIRREKLTLVHECPPGSPASEAGLQKGDELLQLNGEAVEKLSLDALRSRLRQKGKTVEITAARGGVTFTRKITLCEYCKLIPPPSKD